MKVTEVNKIKESFIEQQLPEHESVPVINNEPTAPTKARKPLTAKQKMAQVSKEGMIGADSIRGKGPNTYIFRKGFYYRHGGDAKTFANRVSEELTGLGIAHKLVDCGEKWAAFKGGASLASQSHWWAVFTVSDEGIAEAKLTDPDLIRARNKANTDYPNYDKDTAMLKHLQKGVKDGEENEKKNKKEHEKFEKELKDNKKEHEKINKDLKDYKKDHGKVHTDLDKEVDKKADKTSLSEAAGAESDIANAVVAEVIKLIGEGHTEVSPDVITTKVSAALGKPFMLKDLVAANNSSPALQHYIDSINPSKIKFSTDILTVKNEDPLKEKEKAQSGVANMASRAAGRSRLGENVAPTLQNVASATAQEKEQAQTQFITLANTAKMAKEKALQAKEKFEQLSQKLKTLKDRLNSPAGARVQQQQQKTVDFTNNRYGFNEGANNPELKTLVAQLVKEISVTPDWQDVEEFIEFLSDAGLDALKAPVEQLEWEDQVKVFKSVVRQLKAERGLGEGASPAERKANRELWDKVNSKGKMPSIDHERYTPMQGLEGPIRLRSGKVVYYDTQAGKYYDRDTDMYLSDEDYMAHDAGSGKMNEAKGLQKRVKIVTGPDAGKTG